MKAKDKLHSLTLDKKKLRGALDDKTRELIKSNKLLQAEIVERKKIEADILEITQAEQRRFGSQIHDGLCQELTAILVFAKSLAQKMEKENKLDLAELKKISDMLLYAVDQARDTARGLYPGELDGATLMHSLEELASRTSGASCVFHCPEPVYIDDNDTATNLFRIAQEAITNALVHGKAHNIKMSFTQDKQQIILAIKDDGTGMVEDLKTAKGIGTKIMKHRARLMNASFEIKPNSPLGILLECRLKRPKIRRAIL